MSNRTRYHSRDRHPWPERPADDAERGRPQYVARAAWDRMSREQRHAVSARAAGTAPLPGARTAEDTPNSIEGHLGLTAADLAILRPLGRRAVVHGMAERLGLPTPERSRPTTTAEEARR